MKTANRFSQFSKLNKLVLSGTSLCDEDNKCTESSRQNSCCDWWFISLHL